MMAGDERLLCCMPAELRLSFVLFVHHTHGMNDAINCDRDGVRSLSIGNGWLVDVDFLGPGRP
jgi:hypothetical protein